MPDTLRRVIEGFGGGVYLLDKPGPEQASNIVNVVLEKNGTAYKRGGCTDLGGIGTSGVRILSLYPWYKYGSSPQILAHGDDGKIYYSTNSGTSWTESGAGVIFSTTAPVSFESFNGFVYMADGTNNVRKWSGSTMTTVSNAPIARYICRWKDTLFLWYSASFPDRLWSSAPGDGDTYPASSWVDLNKGDGDSGTAIFTESQYLIVAKQKKTFVVINPTTFENRVVDYEKGVESHFSVLKYDSDIYYLTRYGIARYIQSAPAELVSGNIEPIFDGSFLALNEMRDHAWGYVFEHRCGWSLVRAGQSLPDFVIEYSPQLPRKPWTFHRFNARAWVSWRDSGERLFFAHNGTNKLAEAFVGVQEFGGALIGFIDTYWEDFGDPSRQKLLNYVRPVGEGRLVIQVKVDHRSDTRRFLIANLIQTQPSWNDPSDKWGGGDVWGVTGSIADLRLHTDVYGRFFSLRITDATEDSIDRHIQVGNIPVFRTGTWSISKLAMDAVMMGDMQGTSKPGVPRVEHPVYPT